MAPLSLFVSLKNTQTPAYLTILALQSKLQTKFGQEHTSRRSHFTPLIDVISLLRNSPVLFDVLGEDEREDRKERTTIGTFASSVTCACTT